jgi:hypothetical protein
MPWTTDDREVFYTALALLAETLGEPLSPARMAGYVAGLEDAPFVAVQIGLREALKTCRFFPKPAEIRELGLESWEWRRLREEEHHRIVDRQRRQLPAPMTADELTANVRKLKQAIAGLARPRRMR